MCLRTTLRHLTFNFELGMDTAWSINFKWSTRYLAILQLALPRGMGGKEIHTWLVGNL